MRKLTEIIGWYGTIAIISAYALTSFGLLSPGSLWYQLLNATGATGIIASSLSKKDYQPAVLNIIWTLIALLAIFKVFLRA